MNTDKPFWKTSEFGMAVTAIGFSFLTVAFGKYIDDPEFINMGREVMKFAVGGYVISRGMAKR